MKVFITGGSGLIGSFLIPRLEARGDTVVNYDRSDGYDILNLGELEQALHTFPADIVVHLAAQSGVEDARSQERHAVELNIMGTVNVLSVCREIGPTNVIVASSNHVYGSQKFMDLGTSAFEDTTPLNQLDLYSATKVCADVMTRAYAHNYGINAVAVRNTNTYGPGDPHHDHIVPGTILSLLRGEEPVIRSMGLVKKSYLYGEDCALAYMTIIDNCERLKGQAVNVRGCDPISAIGVVSKLIKIDGGNIMEPVKVLGEPNDQSDENLDGFKMKSFGWKPRHTLDEGLQKTYDSFKENTPA